jgi:hypothetical protein
LICAWQKILPHMDAVPVGATGVDLVVVIGAKIPCRKRPVTAGLSGHEPVVQANPSAGGHNLSLRGSKLPP